MSRSVDSLIRILICGAGNRVFPKTPQTSLFRGWFSSLRGQPDFEVVGVQDVSEAALTRVRSMYPLDGVPTFLDLNEALRQVECDAVLIAPIAEAHAAAAGAAIAAGRHVLMEKPMVTRLADGVTIVEAAARRGLVVSIVQNWRAKSTGLALREAVQAGRIGQVGNIFFRYVRDREQSHLPAYLFDEPFPLLYAMAIHHFDLFRFALDDNIVSVEGRTFTPPWSRYKLSPGVCLWMHTARGVAISYSGTFSSCNTHVPQESLVIDGALGSISNDSAWGEPPLLLSHAGKKEVVDLTPGADSSPRVQYDHADEVYLRDFAAAIRERRPAICPPDDNIWTLAAIDAAAKACASGTPVSVVELLEAAGSGQRAALV